MDTTRRNWIRFTLYAGLAGAAVLLWIQLGEGIRLRSPSDSSIARAPRWVDLHGASQDLESLRGKVVLVNLWASWCGPCRAEVPRLNRLQRDYASEGLVVLGMNTEALTPSRMGQIQADLAMEYPVVIPLQLLAGTSFEGQGVVPHSWLVDREGRLRASQPGLVSERSFRKAVRQLLAEPAPDSDT